RPVGDAIVVADLPLLLDAQDLVEVDALDRDESRAMAGRIGGEAARVGREVNFRMKALAASTVAIPASLSSLGNRSCSVWNARSDRPLASGEKAPICSTPSCASARPTWVGQPRSTSPALVVRK